MAKKKNKQIIRPWCWYCEREFEDEKVLMQHQKAKHFKCNMCPRRLNTAGGLAVHIQQVHKLEPENLPRIENAMPGRDGYEVEIFGMEGIPAPDVADYKRRKEIELGLAAGSISQPQPKRPKIEKRPLSEDELKAQLEAHKALMGGSSDNPPALPAADNSAGAVYGAPPQAYAAPPTPAPCISPPGMPPLVWYQVRLLHFFREGHPLPALYHHFRHSLACPASFQGIPLLVSRCLLLASCPLRVCFPQVRHLFLPEVFGHHSLRRLHLCPLVQHHRSRHLHQDLDLALLLCHRLRLWDHPLQLRRHLH
ncbi:hypothetical protein EDD22DRAFT_373576 [Suillus occidentalis]|nr:hypothetical protein EDD22DRAFT_373576 [Suillus occidentalis]